MKIFETVYELLAEHGQTRRLLAGDFNAPRAELPDGQAVPFGYERGPELGRRQVNAELNMLKGFGHFGLLDVFRIVHGYGELDVVETSWRDKRFDHLFSSRSIGASECFYDPTGLEYSDHAPLVAELKVGSP